MQIEKQIFLSLSCPLLSNLYNKISGKNARETSRKMRREQKNVPKALYPKFGAQHQFRSRDSGSCRKIEAAHFHVP